MQKVAVITGAGAGVGRAAALEFARNGFDVALLSRDPDQLEATANAVRAIGRKALPIPTDASYADQVEAAASRVEGELGAITVWVNAPTATAVAPVSKLTADEILRATQVTYLGQVHGMMAALKRMRIRRHGKIINVGSVLDHRIVAPPSVYRDARSTIRGFTNSLRSEIIHDHLDIAVTMVQLPAVNTRRFGWALNKMKWKAQPAPPIFEPEVAARAIHFAATHNRREIRVRRSTMKAFIGHRLVPGTRKREILTDLYRKAVLAGVAVAAVLAVNALLSRRQR